MAEVGRLLRELDHADYEQLLGFFPVPVLHAICLKIPGFEKILPGLSDPAKFGEYVKQVDTKEQLQRHLDRLEEPSAEELRSIIQLLRFLAPAFKQVLDSMATRILPTGGPEEQLADPVEVRALYNEFCDATKNGESSKAAMQRIAKRKDVGVKTIQRRFGEERKRRASLAIPPVAP